MTLAYVVKRYKIDVINVHNVFTPGSWSYHFSRFFGTTPVVGTPHGDDIQTIPETGWGIRTDKAGDTIVRRNIKAFTLLTAISKPICKELNDIGIEKDRIHMIPNGVWTRRFQSKIDQSEMRKKLGIPEQVPVLLSIGRNHPVKGYKYALEAIAKLRDHGKHISYVLIGRNMSDIVDHAKNLGISDCLITPGEIESTEIPDFMKASDIFVSPSIVESFGLTTLEAMSAGLPCIVTESSGIKDLIDPEACLIVAPADSAKLAGAIKNLIDFPEMCNQMGLKAQVEAKKFDWPVVAKAYESAYVEAIHIINSEN